MVNTKRREADELESLIGGAFAEIKENPTFKYASVKSKFDGLRKSQRYNIRIPFKRFLEETHLNERIYKKNGVRVFLKEDVINAFNSYVERIKSSKGDLEEWEASADEKKVVRGTMLGYAKKYAMKTDGSGILDGLTSRKVFNAVK